MLRAITGESDRTKERIASGLRVGAASDSAAYWSIATTMRSTRDLVSTVKDGLGLALATIDAALNASKPVIDELDGITNDFIQAGNYIQRRARVDTPELRKYDADVRQRISNLRDIIRNSGFNGVNLLYRPNGAAKALDIPAAVDVTSGLAQTIKINIDLTKTALIDGDPSQANFGVMSKWLSDPQGLTRGWSFFNSAGSGPLGTRFGIYPGALAAGASIETELQSQGKIFAELMENTRGVFATLGALRSRIELQMEHADLQLGVMAKGIGALVDADMNDESTRLKALEAQRQLATQSLSLINQQANHVLMLFKA